MSSASQSPGGKIFSLKRPRPVKSCSSCRSKKLKCDREQPCAQCTRASRAEQCQYDGHSGSLGSQGRDASRSQGLTRREVPLDGITGRGDSTLERVPHQSTIASADVVQNEIRELRTRMNRLESLISSSVRSNERQPSPLVDVSYFSGHGELAEEQATDSEVKYHGLHNTRSLVFLFPDVVSFVSSCLSDPDLKPEFERLNRNFPKQKSNDEDLTASTDSILTMLPGRETMERLILQYARYFPDIYQVLDIPTFRQQYQRFCSLDISDVSAFRADFVPLLALVVGFGSQFDSALNLQLRLDCRKVCELVGAWLTRIDHKRRLQPTTLQIMYLLVLFSRVLSVSPLQLWQQYTGDMVRSALTIGLHKDPDEIDVDMPPLEVSLRRRLWYAIANLDVDMSTLCRMPSLLQSVPYSCKPPDNRSQLPDTSRLTRSKELLEADGADEPSYQWAYASSLPLRVRALQLLMQPHPPPRDVQAMLKDLDAQRISLSLKLRLSDSMASSGLLHMYNSLMLDMCLRRPMISLTTLGLQCPGYLESKDDVSRSISLCLSVMSYSDFFEPEPSSGEAEIEDHLWTIFQCFNRDDILRASYSVCFFVRLVSDASHEREEPSSSLGPQLDIPKLAIRRATEDVVKSYIEKLRDLRPILKQIMALALVSESIRQGWTESMKQDFLRAGLQRVLNLCLNRHNSDQRSASHESQQSELSDLMSSTGTIDFDQSMWQDVELDPGSFDWNLDLSLDVQLTN